MRGSPCWWTGPVHTGRTRPGPQPSVPVKSNKELRELGTAAGVCIRPLPLVAGRTPALWTSCLPAFWKAPWGAYPCAGPGDPVASLASQLYRSPSLGEGLLVPPGPGCSHAPWLLPSLGGRPLACCLR